MIYPYNFTQGKENSERSLMPFINKKQYIILPTIQALTKMYMFVKHSNIEISWYGTVDIKEDKDNVVFKIEDVYLFNQTCSTVETTIESKDWANAVAKLIREGRNDIYDRLFLWGHSHVNMGIHPSGRDDKQMEDFYTKSCSTYMIRLICNKDGDMDYTIYDYISGIIIKHAEWMPFEVYTLLQSIPNLKDLDKDIEKEIEEKQIDSTRKINHGRPSRKPYFGDDNFFDNNYRLPQKICNKESKIPNPITDYIFCNRKGK